MGKVGKVRATNIVTCFCLPIANQICVFPMTKTDLFVLFECPISCGMFLCCCYASFLDPEPRANRRRPRARMTSLTSYRQQEPKIFNLLRHLQRAKQCKQVTYKACLMFLVQIYWNLYVWLCVNTMHTTLKIGVKRFLANQWIYITF